jgi:type II secretory pathway component PulC
VSSFSSLDDIKEEELFLVSYPEEKLADFRDLFRSAIPIAQEIEEEQVVAFPEELREEVVFLPLPEYAPSPEETKEDPPPPPIHLQGVVVSDSRQAVIVKVGEKIQILTNEKDLSSDINFIEVEGKEVVLNYEGREITLAFEE